MSMLTPLGAPVRHRRAVRAVARLVIVLLLLAILGAAGYASWKYLVQKTPATTTTTCPKKTTGAPAVAIKQVPPLDPAKFSMNVFNATTRTGLASTVAAEMRKRRFRVVEVKNDPLNKKIISAAEVRSGPRGVGGARTVAAQVTGPVIVLADKRADSSVDLVLGARWTTLAKPATAAAALRAKPKPVRVPAVRPTTAAKC